MGWYQRRVHGDNDQAIEGSNVFCTITSLHTQQQPS